MIAINLSDLTEQPDQFRVQLLLPQVLGTPPTLERVGRELDDVAVVLRCGEMQALAVAHVLNVGRRRPLRVYESGPRGGWRRLPWEEIERKLNDLIKQKDAERSDEEEDQDVRGQVG